MMSDYGLWRLKDVRYLSLRSARVEPLQCPYERENLPITGGEEWRRRPCVCVHLTTGNMQKVRVKVLSVH